MTIAVVYMMLLAGEAKVVEGLPATDMKEPTSKQDSLKEEPQPEEKSLEVAPEKAGQGGEGEASAAGEDEKKVGEETSNAKDGGDDDGGAKESADTNGGDDGQSGTELENLEITASTKNNGEATNTEAEDVPLTTIILDQSNNMTTNSNSTQITNPLEPGSDANVNGMEKSTDSYDTDTSASGDTMVSDGSSSTGNQNYILQLICSGPCMNVFNDHQMNCSIINSYSNSKF